MPKSIIYLTPDELSAYFAHLPKVAEEGDIWAVPVVLLLPRKVNLGDQPEPVALTERSQVRFTYDAQQGSWYLSDSNVRVYNP